MSAGAEMLASEVAVPPFPPMVTVEVATAMLALVGDDSVTVKLRAGPALSRTVTGMVWAVSPAAKVRVPLAAV